MEKKNPSKYVQAVYKANKTFGKVESTLSMIILWALIAVCVIFISCRFLFHVSTPWADESARYLLIALAWFGGSYAASVGDHLEIDIIGTILKKAKNSKQIMRVIDYIGKIIVLVVVTFFAIQFFKYMLNIHKLGTWSVTLPFSMVVPMSFVFIGCILIIIHTIFQIMLPRELWHGEDISILEKGDEQ